VDGKTRRRNGSSQSWPPCVILNVVRLIRSCLILCLHCSYSLRKLSIISAAKTLLLESASNKSTVLAYRQHYIPHRDSFESVIVYAMTTRYNYGGGFMHSYTLPSYLEQRIIMILHWQHLIIENKKKLQQRCSVHYAVF